MTRAAAEAEAAACLVDAARALADEGLNPGTSGNLSLRIGETIWVTPSGVDPRQIDQSALVSIDVEGRVRSGTRRPTSEWPLHTAIYRSRADVNAVVHCHSHYATVLACARKAIPPLHYMIAVASPDHIPCVAYATFGGDALGRLCADGLRGRDAILLANHGQVAVGVSLGDALRVAREVEILARTYVGTLSVGGPVLLDEQEMADARAKFPSYLSQRNDAT